jgi:hypothetical protein
MRGFVDRRNRSAALNKKVVKHPMLQVLRGKVCLPPRQMELPPGPLDPSLVIQLLQLSNCVIMTLRYARQTCQFPDITK